MADRSLPPGLGPHARKQHVLRWRNLARELAARALASALPSSVSRDWLGKELLRFGTESRHLYFRLHSRGDRGVVRQVLRRSEYGIDKWKQGAALKRFHEEHSGSGKFLCVDAGANIGASALYFCLSFPGCRVIAVEPEQGNCELLRRNVSGFPVDVLEGAVTGRDGTLYLKDLGRSDWGFQVGQAGLYPIPAWSMDSILATHGEGRVPFILKMDIEGAEEDVFNQPCEWLARFALVVIELHDWMSPGQATSRTFYRRIIEHDFDIVQQGENTFCFNNALLRPYY